MSTPCTTCGEPLDPATDRCPTCGALASPADETVVAVADDPTRTGAAPPWSIPIREPALAAAAPTTDRRARSVGLALLAVGVVAVATLVGAQLLDRDSGAKAADSAQAAPVGADEAGGLDADAIRTTTTATTTTPSTTSTQPTSTIAPSPPSTTTAPTTVPANASTTSSAARTGPNGTGSVPALSTSFRGWLAQLTSVPYRAGTDGLRDEWTRLRGAVPGAVAARSDDWSAFRDGFWVLVDPGPFRSADDVRSFCAAAGFDGEGSCLPRELRG